MNPLKKKLNNSHLILGSQSPRRKELLSELGVPFEVIVKDVDETFPGNLSYEDAAIYIAKKKAGAFSEETIKNNTIVITADSIVCIDEMILGKPEDDNDACRMLKILSGREHLVITGVCIKSSNKMVSFFSKTKVKFKTLREEEINTYVQQCKPMDKAGSYGIQEWIGYIAVEYIAGSYTNVMGLPLYELYEELLKF